MTVRIVVVDDQSAIREGLAVLLDLLPDVSVVGQAGDGIRAVELVEQTRPDVVLMDLHMPRCDGIEATRQLRISHPETRIVVLTTYADDESVLTALQAGALGYLTKDATQTQLRNAIHAAAAGQSVLDDAVRQRLLAAALGRPQVPAQPEHDLTAREVDVLRLVAAGHSNREIAQLLVLSDTTIKTHINHIFAKTGSRDRAQAVHYAYTHGIAQR